MVVDTDVVEEMVDIEVVDAEGTAVEIVVDIVD